MRLKDTLQEYGDVIENQEMKYHTTFRIGGKVKYSFYPFSIKDLQIAMPIISESGIPYKVIGSGSNILWCDEDSEMIVIFLDHYLHHYLVEDNILECEAGCSIIKLALYTKELGLSNLEFASGIPASVGGCTYMNAGAYKMDMSDVLIEALVLMDGELVWLNNYDLHYAYRHSILMEHPNWIVVKVRIGLIPKEITEIDEVIELRRERRMATQPLDKPCAGSTFKNPIELPAWKCIEDSGLRGYNIGGAKVSEKHCNFVINYDNASNADVLALIDYIKKHVKAELNIDLFTEVEQFVCPKPMIK